uniref:Uncharacterized protein n=1 Tax=Glossina pallidipes TaxID=7398 RepID=A0A1B0A9U3_GLOPL
MEVEYVSKIDGAEGFAVKLSMASINSCTGFYIGLQLLPNMTFYFNFSDHVQRMCKINLFSGLKTTYLFLAATTDVFEVCRKPLNAFKIHTQNNRTTNTITALSTFARKRTMALEPEVACHSLETFVGS